MSLHEAFTFKRIASFLLALVLVLGILPVSPHVHAAEGEENVVLTNMAGEKADTFTSGEPIYVETNG